MRSQHGLDDRLAAAPGEMHVHEYDIGLRVANGADRLVDLGRGADHVDPRRELGLDARQEQTMVVDEEHARWS